MRKYPPGDAVLYLADAIMEVKEYAALAAIMMVFGAGVAYAEGGFDTIRFIQYLDESTALDEVKKGNLDIYYWRIPSEWLSDPDSREGLQVYESTGNSYSILLNPAPGDKFNPFTIPDIRFAVNYLLDRNLVVNELLGGYGVPMMSYYGQYDPEYINLIDELESYNFGYNPSLARSMIQDAMESAGGTMEDGMWIVDGEPVHLTFVIRSDDPTRKSIGEILALEMEEAGFVVEKDYGDLNKAFVVVYGSNPEEQQWSLYTEGWARFGFVRYDSVGLAQMYSPWFSLMPGFNDPAYWNYQHPRLDNLTQAIYSGDFESAEERTALMRQAVSEGVNESVRIFLAGRAEQYVVHEDVEGVINDFGAGIAGRFTPINARTPDNTLDVGVKQIYQGSWNPVAGFTDIYSLHVWGVVMDPPLYRHPYSGSVIPLAADWEVQTAGPRDTLPVPSEAVLWDAAAQSWSEVGPDVNATSMVTFHYSFGNWHHGVPMGMDDILYGIYFAMEWGDDPEGEDRTFDPEFSPRTGPLIDTIKGVRIVDQDTLEVYVDYWHFDDGEIADWASAGLSVPWEIYHAMELAVIDGRTAFSPSVASSKEVSWLSLIIPNDVAIIEEYLQMLGDSGAPPAALMEYDTDFDTRYHEALKWIGDTGHAAIGNGPYVLDGYSPESRTMTLVRNQDESYPFASDRWSVFEDVSLPQITRIDAPQTADGGPFDVSISAQDATSIKYFVTDSTGQIVVSGDQPVSGSGDVVLSVDSSALAQGAASLKVFALSEDVLRPDSLSREFLVTAQSQLPTTEDEPVVDVADTPGVEWVAIPAVLTIGIGVGIALVYRRRKSV